MVQTNCYFLLNEETKEALIVDPAEQGRRIYDECVGMGYQPVAILLTHGHFDHIMGIGSLVKAGEEQGKKIPVYAEEHEKETLADSEMNLCMGFGIGVQTFEADETFTDGQEVTLAGMSFQVIHTPGHTPGSCCFYFKKENVLISGDTLFAQSFGRTDFPGGSARALANSIQEKLFVLPDETKVYPGHNESTTIGFEKKYNPISDYF